MHESVFRVWEACAVCAALVVVRVVCVFVVFENCIVDASIFFIFL